jgi:hypothetical protein
MSISSKAFPSITSYVVYKKYSITQDNKDKLLLFKTLKTEYKLEFYLKYPDNAIRKLICQFRVSDRILSILSISFNVLILDGYKKSSRKAVLNLSLIVQYKKKCAYKYQLSKSVILNSKKTFYTVLIENKLL